MPPPTIPFAQAGVVPGLAPRVIPFPRPDVAVIEPFNHPLYSAAAFDAAVIPAEVTFFTYGQGNLVSGAGAGAVIASEIHTNLRTPARLSSPKIALITGFSLVVPQLTAPLTAMLQVPAGVGEAAIDLPLVTDLQRLLYGTVFRFSVGGTKEYYTAPSWNIPGNVGVEGVITTDINMPAAGGPAASFYVSVQGMGRFEDLYQSPIFIPSEQEFQAALIARQPVPPTLVAARLIYAVLPAIQGREVM